MKKIEKIIKIITTVSLNESLQCILFAEKIWKRNYEKVEIDFDYNQYIKDIYSFNKNNKFELYIWTNNSWSGGFELSDNDEIEKIWREKYYSKEVTKISFKKMQRELKFKKIFNK